MFEKLKNFFELRGMKLKISDILLLFLPVIIFFHYYPQISFGEYGNTRLAITLPIIYLVIFFIASLANIWHAKKTLLQNWYIRIFFAFNIFNTISLIWTGNFVRGLLTIGVLWLLFIATLTIISNPNIKKLLPGVAKALLLGAVIASIFAWFQVLVDALGASSSTTLLCGGCVSENYGYARASAFAHEPQFFGSILTIAILALVYLLIKQRSVAKIILLVFLMATMTMTVSRGAILGLVVGMILLLFVARKMWKGWLVTAGYMIAGVLIGIAALGLCAEINQRSNMTFIDASSNTVYNLSQGLLDFRPTEPPVAAPAVLVDNPQPNTTDQEYGDNYLDVSANIRTSLWRGAITEWSSSSQNIIIGVGAGGTGVALRDTVHGDFAVVQNQFLEVLLEGGIIAFALFMTMIICWLRKTRQNKVLWAILVALLVQWCFFSGYYPNSVHIIVFVAFGLVFSSKFARIS